MNVELNEHGVNKCIKAHLLPDEEMRKIGFTDFRDGYWSFYKDLDDELSFNVVINKENTEDLQIDVLDEEFLQHYDYQKYLRCDSNFKFALKIKDRVEDLMLILQFQGVISGHIKGEYI